MVNLETKSTMTSVLNSATSAAHHAEKAEKPSHSKTSGADAAGAGDEFSALFGAMMGQPGGQDLAVPEGKASPPLVGLAAQVLGPAVHIITASSPTLSDESLYAFARSQGMGEEALALIFQKPALVTAAVAGLATAFMPQEKAMASVPSESATGWGAQADSLDLGDETSLRWTLGKTADAVQTSLTTTQSNFFGLNGLRPLLPTTAPAQVTATDPAEHPESARQTLAASLILGASEAAQFARRLEMKQASQRAERVAPGSLSPMGTGSGPVPTAEARLLAGDASITTLDTLAIATDLAPEDLSQLLHGRQTGGEGKLPTTSDASSTSTTGGAPRPDQSQRTEQYERLSQRLGEALGQRLAAQIARGDWRVDLALKPHELGNIDIELNMKDGALQASFSASQALTRELIADSLPRLKEILNQLGMDVATMDVNVRQNGQDGGNPTPGRSSSGSGSQAGKGETDEAGEDAASMAARRIGEGPDGLDILV